MAETTTQAELAELAELAATYRDAKHTLDVCTRRLHAAVITADQTRALTIPQIARTLGVVKSRVYAIIARGADT